jgi:HD-like signal output (HDOD) protein
MKRILFVDDERNILDGIRRLLYGQRRRWDMHFVLSGEAALEACDANPFDIVISDMRMPGMDGATLLTHIRDRFPGTARLILSGYSELILATRAAPVAYRVLAKPCDGPDLIAVIERVCALQDLLQAPELRRIIGTIGELPSLSTTYSALTLALRDPNTSIGTVADIIASDVAMAAKVLQLVNSGFFGLSQTITSIQSAVNYLGTDTVRNLVVATDTFRVFVPHPCVPPFFCEHLQRHAHRAALIVGTLPLDPRSREIAIVASLLQDIGGLILATKMPELFCAVLTLSRKTGCRQFEAEEQIFGTSHAEIGAYLLGLWGINPQAVEAVAHHHRPTRISHAGLDAPSAVYLAGLLAHQLDTNPDDHESALLPEPDRECLENLNLLTQFSNLRARAREILT